MADNLPSCADCLEIWEPEPVGTLRSCPGCNGIDLPLSRLGKKINPYDLIPFM
jgi:hypothetical protein